MTLTVEVDFKNRLLPQATVLVERAIGANEPAIVDALLDVCSLLENSAKTNSPIVAMERDVYTDSGTYHLNIRRLSTSVPAGKFQILITREIASGLIY